MSETTVTGVSLPKALLETIDEIRGDVSRSKFVQRALEKAIEQKRGSNE
ncbi:MAG: ribbon-helix-helix protein, CopG family [Nitrososphaerales archaeon]|jgi:metal-responsive CopG/Arc/MetJ family transcriptional regulator